MFIFVDPITDQEWHIDSIDGVSSLPTGCVMLTESEIASRRQVNLSDSKILANTEIDIQAGLTRLKYITDVPGQAETYLQKAQDATNYKVANYPSDNITNYPYVAGYAIALYGATPTPLQYQTAADIILEMQAAWIAKGAQIEQARSTGKVLVEMASTIDAINTARITTIAALNVL